MIDMGQKKESRGYIQTQGDLHEAAALKIIGGDAENLNNNPKLEGMGLHGGNYPNFDIFSSSEICSVKSHFTQDGDPNIQTYKNDFSKMLGWGKAYKDGLSPLEQDARRISESAARDVPIPSEIKGANQEKVVQYLQEKSTMRVPSNHVDEIREALVEDAKNLPSNYFLPENPTEEQLKSLADRVQSTGLSSMETFEQMNSEQTNLSESSNEARTGQEQVTKTEQENAAIILENPLDETTPDTSINEDYHYGYGY
jgi:hypothetical protein